MNERSLALVVGLGLAGLAPRMDAAAQPPPDAEAAEVPESDAASESGQLVSDGPVAVRASVAPDPSNIGDLLTLEIVAAYPRGYAVNLPTSIDVEPLHLVQVEEGEPESTGQGLRKKFRVEVQAFSVGEQKVPSFPVTYVDADGAVHTITLPPVTFMVESLLANVDDPARKGEDPPVSLQYPNDRAELIAWSAAGTLLLALLGWWLWRRLRSRTRVEPAPTPIPPHEVAYAALEELAQGDLLGSERYADYYVQLTEITKGYLQGRFGLHALDRTTDEIRAELVRNPSVVEPLSPTEVIELLQRYDLVKFARFAPPVEEAESDLQDVRTVVDRTRPERETPKATRPEAAEPEPELDASDDPDHEPPGPEERQARP